MKTKRPPRVALHTGNIWLAVLWSTIVFFCQPSLSSPADIPAAPHAIDSSYPAHLSEGVAPHAAHALSGWNRSGEGKAYSEFNHRLAGALVLLIGLSELHGAWGITAWSWVRLLLPGAMLAAGTYLAVWSDHDAWPIGSQTFMDMFFGGDTETLQHKSYAFLLLVVGTLELFRRSGRLQERYWALPLPTFAVIGGSLLFLHSHSDHPSAHQIALHHLTMGVTSLMAGTCLLVSEYSLATADTINSVASSHARWKGAWGIFVLIIGIQLLVYAE